MFATNCMSNYPPPERALELTEEFIKAITNNMKLEDFQYFVEQTEKLHPDDRHKVFYNIAEKIKELSQM